MFIILGIYWRERWGITLLISILWATQKREDDLCYYCVIQYYCNSFGWRQNRSFKLPFVIASAASYRSGKHTEQAQLIKSSEHLSVIMLIF